MLLTKDKAPPAEADVELTTSPLQSHGSTSEDRPKPRSHHSDTRSLDTLAKPPPSPETFPVSYPGTPLASEPQEHLPVPSLKRKDLHESSVYRPVEAISTNSSTTLPPADSNPLPADTAPPPADKSNPLPADSRSTSNAASRDAFPKFDITWSDTPVVGVSFTKDGCEPGDPLAPGYGMPLSAIRLASQQGCQKCTILYRSFVSFGETVDESHFRVLQGPKARHLFQTWSEAEHTWSPSQFQLFVRPGTPTPSWDMIKQGRDHLLSRRDEFAPLLTEWVSECVSNHAACKAEEERQLPTRVIDVGDDDGAKPFLHLSSAGEVGRYTALSHCWGKGSLPFKTTTSNIQQMRQGFDINALPKSFQDAIIITRALKLRYIWIDSVCIVQNDPLDWERESSRMLDVYHNAHVVVAASQGKDSTVALLDRLSEPLESDFLALPLPKLKYGPPKHVGQMTNLDGSVSQIYARRRKLCVISHDQHLQSMPLAKRAWAFQENLVARRIVHFTDTEILWECVECVKCECMETDYRRADDTPAGFVRRLQFEGISHMHDEKWTFGPAGDTFENWRVLLRRYTSLELTFESDRLPALSGLAKFHQSSKGAGQYLAGLWRDDLLQSLLWRAWSSGLTIRPSPYRAPTWSPFSLTLNAGVIESDRRTIRYKVTDGSRLEKALAEVLDAECTPAGEDPTGAVKDGYIILAGKILRVEVKQAFRPSSLGKWRNLVPLFGEEIDKRIAWDLEMDFEQRDKLCCFLIGEGAREFDGLALLGLILKPATPGPDAYVRVGILHEVARDTDGMPIHKDGVEQSRRAEILDEFQDATVKIF